MVLFNSAPANVSFGAGSQIAITVPGTWTQPSFTNVSIVPGTCTPTSHNVVGFVIYVTMGCAAGTSFQIDYGSGSNLVTAQATTGTALFNTTTVISGGTAAAISPVPSVMVVPTAASGSGTMTLSAPPWTTAGSTNNQLVFNFSAPTDASFVSGSAVAITMPGLGGLHPVRATSR